MTNIAFRDSSPTAGTVAKWPKLKLTAQQQQLWDETRTAVLWSQPSFSDVWYAMMIDSDGQTAWFTDQVPFAATDDKFMYINPNTFFQYTLEERVFICLHEICHCMFNHCGLFYNLYKAEVVRYTDGIELKYVDKIMQIAADCVINAILFADDIGSLPKDAWHMPNDIPPTMAVLDAYRLLYKIYKRRGGGGFGYGKSFDKHLRPGQGRGKTPAEAESERNPQQWTNAINAAIQSAKLAGNLPANIARLFNSALEVKTDWREQLAIVVGRAIGRDRYSWNYLDSELALRGIGFPGRVRYGCELVIVAVDTSSSVNQETMDMFLSHVAAIIETVKPRRIIVTECDATIHSWKEITDVNDLDGKVRGGGGTDFYPVFNRVEAEQEYPDALVYLTDLYGDVPRQEPDYPVIWGCINDNVAPWGKTVHIPEQANKWERESFNA